MEQTIFLKKYSHIFILAGIILLTVLIYANSLGNDFVNWDDPENIINNPTIHELSLKNLVTYFTTDLRLMYTPLVSISYAIDYQIGKLNPFIYHFTNLFLHLCNIILIFWIFRVLTPNSLIALSVAALFAVHPVNVDGISWISTRSSLLCTFFYAAALVFYVYYLKSGAALFRLEIKYQKHLNEKKMAAELKNLFSEHAFKRPAESAVSIKKQGKKWLFGDAVIRKEGNQLSVYKKSRFLPLLLSAFFFLCAVLSKSSAVVLPAVLLLFDYYRGRRLTWQLLLEKIPFGVISLLIGLVTLQFRADQGYTDIPLHYNLFDRFIVICSSFGAYLFKLLLPVNLSYSYSFPEKSGGFLPFYYYFIPFLLGLVVWAFSRLKFARKTVVFGFLFFFLNTILSQAVLLLDNYQSNRYAYLPYVGLFFILAVLFEKGISSREGWQAIARYVWTGLAVVFIVFCSVLTVQRNALWKNSITILDDLLAKQPNTVWAYINRGAARMNKKDYTGAIEDFNRCEQLNPDYPRIYFKRAVAKQSIRDYSGALADYNKVVSYFPTNFNAFNNRALVRKDLGDYQGALNDLSRAIELRPDYSTAYFNRALVRIQLQDAAGACGDAQRALELGHPVAAQLVQEQCKS